MSSAEALALREQFGSPQQQRDTAIVGHVDVPGYRSHVLRRSLSLCGLPGVLHGGLSEGSREMTRTIGAVNTAVLFTSSLTLSLAIHAISKGKQVRTYVLLLVTVLIGMLFLGLKFTEYFLHYQEHKVPDSGLNAAVPMPEPSSCSSFSILR